MIEFITLNDERVLVKFTAIVAIAETLNVDECKIHLQNGHSFFAKFKYDNLKNLIDRLSDKFA